MIQEKGAILFFLQIPERHPHSVSELERKRTKQNHSDNRKNKLYFGKARQIIILPWTTLYFITIFGGFKPRNPDFINYLSIAEPTAFGRSQLKAGLNY